MNRYQWLAAGLCTVTAASVAYVLSGNPSGPGLDLALNIVSTAAAVGTGIFGVIGTVRARTDTATGPRAPQAPRWPAVPGDRLRPRDQSRADYLSQMRAYLLDIEAEQGRLVATARATEAGGLLEPEMLPGLEWLNRRPASPLAAAEPERVDLAALPERFRRCVLLGEPGSGKSTCLRHLALTRLHALPAETAEPAEQLPLYVPLSEWPADGSTAVEFLRARLESLLGPTNYYVGNFHDLLSQGAFLLLLDGLNEMPGRRPSRQEGRHDGAERGPALSRPGRMDRREAALRELAQNLGVRATFLLSCRSHEYFDSLEWQVVRLAPISEDQIDRYLDVAADQAKAAGLRQLIEANPTLAAIAGNPFFLATLTRVYEPGFAVDNRGSILAQLLRTLLAAQRGGRHDVSDGTAVEVVGRLAYRMLRADRIGSQATLPPAGRDTAPAIDALVDTGLLARRGDGVSFRHQIVQEFFAAAALHARAVRASPKSLLRHKRFSEVVALWTDLDPQRMPRRVEAALRTRNLPWRRPPSGSGVALIVAYFAVVIVALFVGSGYLADWIAGRREFLPEPWLVPTLPYVPDYWAPGATVAAGYVLWRVASSLAYHRATIVNAAHVLAVTDTRSSIARITRSLRLLMIKDRGQVARSLGRFGKAATPHLLRGAASRDWRIRAGSVQALGEVLRTDPTDQAATEALLSLTRADDQAIARPLIEALSWCQDPRAPQAMASVLRRGTFRAVGEAAPLRGWHAAVASRWGDDVLDHFDKVLADQSDMAVRKATLHLVGMLRLTGCEPWLARYARTGPWELREAAVAGLGLVQSAAAAEELIGLAETYWAQGWQARSAAYRACAVLGEVAAPEAVGILRRGAAHDLPPVRAGVAMALGRAGGSDAVPELIVLTRDDDPEVRALAVAALGRARSADAAARLAELLDDPDLDLAADALAELCEHYPQTAEAILPGLVAEPGRPLRLIMVRRLGTMPSPAAYRVLRDLTGDIDRRVRRAAQLALADAGKRADAATVGIRHPWLHPFAVTGRAISRIFHFDEVRVLRDQEVRSAGTAGSWGRVFVRIGADAQLTARYYRLLRLIGWSMIAVVLISIGFVAVLMRASLWFTGSLSQLWPVIVAVGGATLASFLPGVRELRDVPVLGGLVWLVRAAALLIVATWLTAAVVYVWWAVFLAIGVIWLMLEEWVARRGRVVAAALAAGPPPL